MLKFAIMRKVEMLFEEKEESSARIISEKYQKSVDEFWV